MLFQLLIGLVPKGRPLDVQGLGVGADGLHPRPLHQGSLKGSPAGLVTNLIFSVCFLVKQRFYKWLPAILIKQALFCALRID